MADKRKLLQLARQAIHSALQHEATPVVFDQTPSQGVFVTLYHSDHSLRGCIGHIQPVHEYLVDEIVECAQLAAFHDPRFSPVSSSELPELLIEISLLHPLEPVRDVSELDPKYYGIVVSLGLRKGLLLPDIEGIETVEQQIEICCTQKAGIDLDEPYQIEKFRVEKIMEEA